MSNKDKNKPLLQQTTDLAEQIQTEGFAIPVEFHELLSDVYKKVTKLEEKLNVFSQQKELLASENSKLHDLVKHLNTELEQKRIGEQ